MPALTGSVHAHILTKPSRAVFAVIRLELIEPGAATCVYNEATPRERSDRGRFLGMPGPFLKSLDSCIYINPTHAPERGRSTIDRGCELEAGSSGLYCLERAP